MKNIAAESMSTYGSKGLSYQQLFQCIGIAQDAVSMLMERTENHLGNIAKMSIQDLTGIKGISANKAAAILAAIEIGRRRQLEPIQNKRSIACSGDINDVLQPHMRDLTQEEFWIILLNQRCQIIKVECIHRGGMSAMVVDPKTIFRKALEYQAGMIVLAHNHPSGMCSPSIEDIRLTEKMKLAGTYIDIKVLDHVIIGDVSYYSFADEGKI